MSEAEDDVVMPSDVAEVDTEPMPGMEGEMAAEAEEGGSWGMLEPLFSTEPDVSPREVKGALDVSVPWHKHLQVGIQKSTGASGMPAFVHYVLAFVLFAKQGDDVSLPSVRGGGGGDDDGGAEPTQHPDVISGDEL